MAAVPAELRQLADQARPTALAGEHLLPLLPGLADLVPGGALRRGAPVMVAGEAALTLALALAAGPSAAGSWVAALGLPSLGLAAAAELGVALERLVLVADPPPGSWGAVAATLVGAFDVVLLPAALHRARAGEVRTVAARARDRGCVLVAVDVLGAGGPRPARAGDLLGAEVRVDTGPPRWVGLADGHGHLGARRVEVEVTGRRAAARPRRLVRWFVPEGGVVAVRAEAPDGRADAAPATVTSLPAPRAHRSG